MTTHSFITPNHLTIARIVAVPLVCVPLAIDTTATCWLALAVFAAAAITDFFDGWLARRSGQISDLGRMLDPIADKLLVGAALVVLAGIGRTPEWHLIPVALIIGRELGVSGLREAMAPRGVTVPVTQLAKWKTTVQLVALGLLILGPHGPEPTWTVGLAALWVAMVLTMVTGWDYLRIALSHLRAS